MAISTIGAFLMKGSGTSEITYAKLVDIKSFPALRGTPDTLETTTMSDSIKKYIFGLQGSDGLQFKANYTKDDFTALKALEGTTQKLALWLGGTNSGGTITPTGSDGKFSFDGYIHVQLDEGEVNDVAGMTISLALDSEIEFA